MRSLLDAANLSGIPYLVDITLAALQEISIDFQYIPKEVQLLIDSIHYNLA